jgi:hypothetical protein
MTATATTEIATLSASIPAMTDMLDGLGLTVLTVAITQEWQGWTITATALDADMKESAHRLTAAEAAELDA